MLFIALEGIDGSGKGTQAKLLCSWLRDKGYSCYLTAEPTDNNIGRLIRKYLKEDNFDPRAIALLFAADRSLHIKDILSKLHSDNMVITERYFYSSLAYQGALGINIDWLEEINSFAPEADIVFYLDIEPEEAIKRMTSLSSFRNTREKESYEKEEFLRRVRQNYLKFAEEREKFNVIDASKSIREVQTDIRRRLGRILSFIEEEKKKGRQTRLEDLL